MIKFKYTPETWDTPLGPLSDPSPIQEMTMTLYGECITWEEATRELHNFLRAAGYVIPYDIEWYEDEDDLCTPLQKLTDKRDADLKIGAWLSAALEDPSTCQSMKDDINEWFECTPQLHRNTMQNEGETNQ